MANVFGREYLLPRDLARQLFVEDRLSAPAIAARLGLPLGMVRLQLFDALLQADVALPKEKGAKKPQKLDPSQSRAVDFKGRALLVEAGPGSGKTKTLVARINRLLETEHPSRILALTFSNKAAAELSSRVMEDKGDEAVEVWTGTFHAFGLEVMKRHYGFFGLGPKIRLLSPSQAVEMLEERLPILGLEHFHDLSNPSAKLKELLRPVWRAKDDSSVPRNSAGWRSRTWIALKPSTPHCERRPRSPSNLSRSPRRRWRQPPSYDEYEKLLRGNGLVDFADLVMLPTLLMGREPKVLEELRDRYREILVDEYQDVNRASAEMIKLCGARRTVSGSWAMPGRASIASAAPRR